VSSAESGCGLGDRGAITTTLEGRFDMRFGIGFARLALAGLLALSAGYAAAAETIRIGVLKFGTVNWEIDSIIHNKLDEANGIKLEPVVLASNDATKIALQAGEVDVIVSDWLFVSRERAQGDQLTLAPFSTSIGAIMVPVDSKIQSLPDLKGANLGVAGGPLDKSWLMLRGLAKEEHGFDLEAETEQAFGAQPLIMEKLKQGELDAALNNWNFNAQLEAAGFREVVGAQEAAKALGAEGPISAIGYVFKEDWADEHKEAMLGFVEASRQAKELLRTSDEEWNRLRPIMNVEDDAVFKNIIQRFRSGIPNRPIAEEESDTAKVYEYLAKIGGEKLVGPATTMAPGTFWSALKESS
jgi:NitT/TauT family transport system substrate-binding protein